MAEIPGRWVVSTVGITAPGINSYVLLYAVPAGASMIYGVDVCNGGSIDPHLPGTGQDAHISIWIIPSTAGWVATGGTGPQPPIYARVVHRQRVECDGVDGNVWVMPVKHLNAEDQVVVFTDTPDVTFYGHGFLYTAT